MKRRARANDKLSRNQLADVRGEMARLLRRSEVFGAFMGVRLRCGELVREERCISVHVLRKLPRSLVSGRSLIPATIAGIPTDVVAVGTPRLAALDVGDKLVNGANDTRWCRLMALRIDAANAVYGLVAGHAVAPRGTNGRLKEWWTNAMGTRSVTASDDATPFVGDVYESAVRSDADYGIVSFGALDPVGVDFVHPGLGVPPPFPVTPPPAPGGFVAHVGSVNGVRWTFNGEVFTDLRLGAEGVVQLDDSAGNKYSYRGVFAVRSSQMGQMFARPGDSGSVVFDGSGRCIGMIIGIDQSGSTAYVLPIDSLGNTAARDFFQWT